MTEDELDRCKKAYYTRPEVLALLEGKVDWLYKANDRKNHTHKP